LISFLVGVHTGSRRVVSDEGNAAQLVQLLAA